MTAARATIGVFGGSGFYAFRDDFEQVQIATPFGPTSDEIAVGDLDGISVAFMSRHGPHHEIPAQVVNYRANIWAFKSLGVTRVLGPCAAGSLDPGIAPGEVVVCDQLVDRTSGRKDTFFDGPDTTHISFADPYCPHLRRLVPAAVEGAGFTVHPKGTVVTIQGPRFSTRAESRWFMDAGWQVVNMTQYPEAYLARELGMCYVGLALVTDFDSGVEQTSAPANAREIVALFRQNIERLRAALIALIAAVPTDRDCECAVAPEVGRISS